MLLSGGGKSVCSPRCNKLIQDFRSCTTRAALFCVVVRVNDMHQNKRAIFWIDHFLYKQDVSAVRNKAHNLHANRAEREILCAVNPAEAGSGFSPILFC